VRLVSFSLDGGSARPGLVVGDEVIDLGDPVTGLPSTMRELLALGPVALEQARAAPAGRATRHALAEVRRHAPVPDPPAILAIGMNYRAHVAEMGREPPEWQYWFNKQRTSIAGPGDDIVLPAVSDMVDYEGELAMVIGRRCQHVPADRAHEVVAGYTIVNDVSARDWQWRTPTFTVGKSFDTHGPIGPWLTTADEVPDPHALTMRLTVNGELRQNTLTGGMIHNIFQQIEHLTTVMTLEPGDILATGTCSGVGIALQPPRFLKPGDVVRVEIDGLGHIENRIVADPWPSAQGESARTKAHATT